jgi:hypothetical protein
VRVEPHCCVKCCDGIIGAIVMPYILGFVGLWSLGCGRRQFDVWGCGPLGVDAGNLKCGAVVL